MTRSLLATLGVLVTLALAAGGAGAHAVLTGSSIGNRALPPGAPVTVTLTFNSGIESGLAKVVLRGAGEEDWQLPTRAGEKSSQVRIDVPALPPGAYALHYKILAVDGHVTESVLRFTVAAR